jgi:rubrerythrin
MLRGRCGYQYPEATETVGSERRALMFPDGRRKLSRRMWQCPWCGTPFKDGDVCPHDDDHWAEFTESIRRTATPALVGAQRLGVA